ncbi:hypothetical protein [Agrobacterium sp. DSM 25558]|uniref:hypothetical protein n=1 Tax=Agrobacterium sp. DSM 25558 TaxID=1907665 RepID=UPI0011786DB4|nr:hypothetical protein [Agrobacterium sp. DSM 25558]
MNTPANLSFFMSVSFQVVGKNVRLALQTGISGRYSIANDPSDGMFFDAMSVKLSGFEAASLAAYGFYEASSIVAATVGEKILMTGFPGMKLHPKSATSLGAVVTQVEGVSVAVSKAGQPGLSGGPATTSSGLVGLVQGTTKTPTEGLITSLLLLKPILFS